MRGYSASNRPRGRWWPAAACPAASAGAFGIICTSTGPVRLIAGLCLPAALACAIWLAHQARFPAIVPAAGLTLVFLILAGLTLTAAHAPGTIPIALATAAATLAIAAASTIPGLTGTQPPERETGQPGQETGHAERPTGHAERETGHAARKAPRTWRGTLAIAGGALFAATAVLAIRYAAASATASGNSASTLAVWAYPAGGRLHIGAQEPPGHPAVSLRIIITRAGTTIATWNSIRLAPGQTWQATTPSADGNRPVQVTALRGGIIVASLSA